MEKTLGSLFDGIGGFPLAGSRHGIKALWASEIEPFPIKATKVRFPDMKHLGDITKIDGTSLEPVDAVTFGSPCQDLSVAGKRAGLAGERSGLFMEAVRIIKEMRNTYAGTNEPIRPRFAVWENVPGAFSSNKGEDFRAVLEETARIADETVVIPRPPKGKWSTVGTIMGNGYSIAWRILDAQYWGVPQRRRRVFLVADFGGQSAPEILFKRKGLSRYLTESREARERTAANAERSVGKAICNEIAGALDSCYYKGCGMRQGVEREIVATPKTTLIRCGKEGSIQYQEDTAATLEANMPGNVINCQPSGISGTVSSKWAKGTGGPAGDEHYNLVIDETARPLSAQPHMRHRLDMDNVVMSVAGCDFRNDKENGDLCGTLQAKPSGGQSINCIHPVRIGYSVRRLTPLECERLQGYPDGWTDIEGASDSGRYKALGNSVAIPCVEYVMEGISEVLDREQRS